MFIDLFTEIECMNQNSKIELSQIEFILNAFYRFIGGIGGRGLVCIV